MGTPHHCSTPARHPVFLQVRVCPIHRRLCLVRSLCHHLAFLLHPVCSPAHSQSVCHRRSARGAYGTHLGCCILPPLSHFPHRRVPPHQSHAHALVVVRCGKASHLRQVGRERRCRPHQRCRPRLSCTHRERTFHIPLIITHPSVHVTTPSSGRD